jgi:hypothetical protein
MASPENAEEQAMELEALEAILADDLQGALWSQLALFDVCCTPDLDTAAESLR